MIYAYMRVSTDKQSTETQHYELLKYADRYGLHIEEWITEAASGAIVARDRRLGQLLDRLTDEDTLLVTELSRLGRSVMDVMSILHRLMHQHVRVISVTESYQLGEDIPSKVLAFAFGLAAEIERSLISVRTREALARKKQEGKTLGRPKGSLSKRTKLTGKENEIQLLLENRVAVAAIARIMGVHRVTMGRFIKARKLLHPEVTRA